MGTSKSIAGATMKYLNTQMRIEDLVGNFEKGKISLIPPFQRGRVWKLPMRQKLMANIVLGKPIPAIFLYKEEDGSRFTFNILDGKQRLESMLLFIANGRSDLAVQNWHEYFTADQTTDAHFPIKIGAPGEREELKTFAALDAGLIREFREYKIPVIEIDLDNEEGSFDELISLFIDINSYGVRVNRFDIIRTMKDDNKLLADTFNLVAIKRKRKKDYLFKTKECDYANILKRLKSVQALSGRQQRVDRVWERMLEIVLYIRTAHHRTLAQILKGIMGAKKANAVEGITTTGITKEERKSLRTLFNTLKAVFSTMAMRDSQLATNQTHFYTLATSLHAFGLDERYGRDELVRKLKLFAQMIDTPSLAPQGVNRALRKFLASSSQKTTHPGRRDERQNVFLRIMDAI